MKEKENDAWIYVVGIIIAILLAMFTSGDDNAFFFWRNWLVF